jgi:hypothetical protein
MRLRSVALGVSIIGLVGMPLLFVLSPSGARPTSQWEFLGLYDSLVTLAGESVARAIWGGLWLLFGLALVMTLRRPDIANDSSDEEAIQAHMGELPVHEITVKPRPNPSLERP